MRGTCGESVSPSPRIYMGDARKLFIFHLHQKSRRGNRMIHSAAFCMETGMKTASGHRLSILTAKTPQQP